MASNERDTALRNAAMDGKLETVKGLLSEGADVNCRISTGNLNTPLHCAAARGHKLVVELLVESGARVDARNSEGETSLHLAIRHDFPQIVEWLLKSGGAEVNDDFDRQENSPLHKAAYLGRISSIEVLLKAGADRTAENEDGKTPLDLAKSDDALTLLQNYRLPGQLGVGSISVRLA